MKEKDIVDFTKMEYDEENDNYINSEGNDVGCQICYTHSQAYKKFGEYYTEKIDMLPLCPKCGERMIDYESQVISEVNYSNPDGEIGYYPVFYCNECDKYFAYMPVEINHNGNHDIYYTGGRDYIEDEEQQKLKNDVFKSIKPSIEQYIRRVVDEKEKGLDLWNIMTWCSRDVEHAIANWLYEHKLKK